MRNISLRKFKNVLSVIFSLFIATTVFMVGCNKKPAEESTVTPPAEITISNTQLSLLIGDTFKLKLLKDGEEEITASWSVQGDCISLNNGTVTALKVGEATVNATVENQTYSCHVTVEPSKTLPLFTVNTSGELYLKVGDVFTIVPSLTYNGENITVEEVDYQFSGNVISVDKLPNQYCNIKANKAGAVDLLIVCNWNNVLLYEQITVIIS